MEAIREEFREIRHDILPRAKAAIERSSGQSEHGRHFGDAAMWKKVFGVEGGSLEWHGKNLKAMARRVRDLPRGIGPSDQAPVGEWTATQLKKIMADYSATGSAACPVDGTRLNIQEDSTTSEWRLLMVLCQRCGRKAANVT